MTMQRTSQTDAVNQILRASGDSPINDIADVLTISAANAVVFLNQVSMDVQLQEWNFNTDKDYPLARDTDGEILIPDNMISVSVGNDQQDIDPVVRGNRLYDKKTFGYTFSRDIKAKVVWALDWDDLPEQARKYITISAARTYAQQTVGDPNAANYTAMDENKAQADLKAHDARTAKYNIFKNFTAARPLIRI